MMRTGFLTFGKGNYKYAQREDWGVTLKHLVPLSKKVRYQKNGGTTLKEFPVVKSGPFEVQDK